MCLFNLGINNKTTAAMLFNAVTLKTRQAAMYSTKADLISQRTICEYLTKRGLLFGRDSDLFLKPTRKGFKLLCEADLRPINYIEQCDQYKKGESIRLMGISGETHYV